MGVPDPYHILGLAPGATVAEIKARYRALARTHHPDKLGHLPEAERRQREDAFKEMTVAYHYLLERGEDGGPTGIGAGGDGSAAWRSVWSRVETMFQDPRIWERMGSILKDTVADVVAAKARAAASATRTTHHIRVPVTLDEVHHRRSKRIRVFLRGVAAPVFFRIHCGLYPLQEVQCMVASAEGTEGDEEEEHNIRVDMVLQEHATYRLDSLLGTQDLYAKVWVGLADVVFGCQRTLVGLDGEAISVVVPPGTSPDMPIEVQGKGLWGQGNLYVSLAVRWPTRADLSRVGWDPEGPAPARAGMEGGPTHALWRGLKDLDGSGAEKCVQDPGIRK